MSTPEEWFGKDYQVRWREPGDRRESAERRAAMLQHAVARAVRSHLKETGRRQYELAKALDWKPDKLSRLFGGHATLSAIDMFLMMGVVGMTLADLVVAGNEELPVPLRDAVIRDYLQDQLAQRSTEEGSART